MLLRTFLFAFLLCESNMACHADNKKPDSEKRADSEQQAIGQPPSNLPQPFLASEPAGKTPDQQAPSAEKVSVRKYGAAGNGTQNDMDAIQKCLDECKASGKICYVPAGTYLVKGDLWLGENSRITGDGNKSKLVFQQGSLRTEKAGKRDFYYTNNYNNEVISGDVFTLTTKKANAGASTLNVEKTALFKPGQLIRTFNNRADSWAILEDSKQQGKWNKADGFARSEIFTVKAVNDGAITLDRPLKFPLDQGAKIRPHVGASNVEVSSLSIDNQTDGRKDDRYAILFEQPDRVTIKNVILTSKCGGINLTNTPYKCAITDCNITVQYGRAILVENFAYANVVARNTINYTTGGDGAIMVLMSSGNNKVFGNKVYGHGNGENNECGIAVHALSYDNEVYNNYIEGTAEGLGAYYGAFDNSIHDNTTKSVKVGFISFNARENEVFNNTFNIASDRKGDKIGALLFSSMQTNIKNNKISGNFVYGSKLQASNSIVLTGNDIRSSNPQAYAFGVKVVSAESGINILKNTISSCKFGIDAETAQISQAAQTDDPPLSVQTNEVSNSEIGIRLQNYTNAVLKDNDVDNFSSGITLSNSPYNVVINNKLSSGKTAAINLVGESSSLSYMENNTMSNTGEKILGWKSPDAAKIQAQPRNGFIIKNPNTGKLYKFDAQKRSFQQQ